YDGYDHKESNRAGARFGYSVGTAGDVNGEEDGDYFSDVIVGAPGYTMGDTNEGRVYVWQGSDDGLLTGHSWYAEANRFNTQLGHSVATAGDVNGDGYADIIVGAVGYALSPPAAESRGVAYVWHGSADGVNGDVNGTLDNYEWREIGDVLHLQMGFSVSTAGDVDGDGYSDVIVGGPCPSPDSPCTVPYDGGVAKLYLGSVLGVEDSAANTDYGVHAGASFGWSVGTAGDVNGDGYADVVVGSPHYTDGQSEEGQAYVWYGAPSSSGISSIRDWDDEGDAEDAYYGASVATAGDVNGDGYSDIIVGAPGHASSAGRAYVYHGGPESLGETAGWTKLSNMKLALFGTSVGTAGDVNGDGYADVIVGAPRWDGGKELEGAAWIYHGAAGGLETAPAWYKRSNQADAEFGTSVGTAGDVNGDGYDDVIVGAPYWTSGEDDEGGAWVYQGSSDGTVSGPLWYKQSDQEGAEFGTSVGTAGDVNGDGYSDVIVGAPFYDHGSEDEGMAWIYHGTDTVPHSAPDWDGEGNQADTEYGRAVGTAGDVNGDGYSDIIVGAPMWNGDNVNEGRAWVHHGSRSGVDETYSWRQRGSKFNAQYGHAVGTAGDVNGDGYSDIIVGAPNWWDDRENEGKVWVYRGSGSGLDFSSSWSKEGGQSNAHYGYSVGTAGDVNGDGYADVIIGVEGWDGGEGNEGGASAYHGSYGGLESSRAWHGESDKISAHYGYSVGTAGDVNGDGYAEVIVGAPNYKRSSDLFDEGKAYLYYGNGRRGVALRPVQKRRDFSPLAHLGSCDLLMMRVLKKSPFGLGGMGTEIEVKPLSERFDGSSTWKPQNYNRQAYGFDTYIVPG
ncbi:FG-GAP-like repeat-containing protein, partial [Chloroflexota bacterium]